ncbi:MAG TPA: isoprenyl transferase [Micropepsaceae bacterium]|nr:isoprenyl transferase [Micropepsaceae bacterium]
MTKPILDSTPPDAPPPNRLPRHVAIIMDGNGRWAKNRLLPREAGHVKGISSVRKVVRAARELGLQYLTLYTFSTENWRRPESEVRHLMGLFRRYCRADIEKLHKHNVRVRFIGARTGLDPDIAGLIESAESLTARNTTLNLAFAFNYGSREEMAEAARVLARAAAAGTLDPERITPDMFGESMQSAGIPDADLVIRSGGERRLSNFLLWQAAYAEFVFTDKLWPDFGAADLEAALAEFARRERRFGGVTAAERGRGEPSLAETALRMAAAEIFDAE